MIAYFDTSALVPLLVREPGSARAKRLWEDAEHVVSTRLAYPEARAALAQAKGLERLTAHQLRTSVVELEALIGQVDVVELDEHLARRAGELAEIHGLRGFDAVHLAAADRLRDPELVIVAGDTALVAAARAANLATASTG